MQNEYVSIEQLSTALNAKRSGDGWIANCPAHDDQTPSFSLRMGSKRPVFHCFAGCSHEAILDALTKKGVAFKRPRTYDKVSHAREVLKQCATLSNVPDSAAAKYLMSRGLRPSDDLLSLHAHSSLEYWEDKHSRGSFPALVGAIQSAQGAITGVSRIFLTHDGKKAAVASPKKILGECRGGFVLLGKLSEKMAVTEGIETGIAVFEGTSLPVLSVLSADNMVKLMLPQQCREVLIFADYDVSGKGQRSALKLRNRLVEQGINCTVHVPVPIIDDQGSPTSTDWLDVYQILGAGSINGALAKDDSDVLLDKFQQEPEPTADQDAHAPGSDENLLTTDNWETPVPLPPVAAPPPPMPLHLVPEPIRPWLSDTAERLGVGVEFLAVVAVAAVGILAGTKVGVHPRSKDDSWVVVCSVLWVAIIASAGKKKTALISAALAPVSRLEKIARAKFEEESKKVAPEIALLEQQCAGIRQKIKNETAHGEALAKVGHADTLRKLIARIAELKVTERRYAIRDATPEKLVSLISENKNGLGAVYDELSGWIKNMEKKGRENERSLFLQGHSGTQMFRDDRMGREGSYVELLFILVIGGIQPGVIRPLVKDAIAGNIGSDGLIQRFQLAVIALKNEPNCFPGLDTRPQFLDG